jgi:signal transduction histidine kinase
MKTWPSRLSCRRYVWAALILLSQLGPAADAYAQGEHKRVLVLYSTRRDSEFSMTGESALPRMLDAGLGMNLDYHSEFIDISRFPDPTYQLAFRDFLRLKYQGVMFDVVVAMQDQATQLVQSHRDSLFAGAPVVFLSNTARMARLRDSTGLIHERDFASTFGMIRQLQPDVRRVFIVTGAARVDKAFEAAVQSQLHRSSAPIELIFLSGLSTNALMEQVSRLPKSSAVYYILVSEDGDGNRFHPLEYLDRLVKVANAPIYCWVDSAMGRGIVGGSVYSQRQAIERVGEVTLRVLRGEPAKDIPLVTLALNTNQVDWHQLRRWRIDESRVPAGTLVRFRDPGIWDRYRHYIAVAVALFVTQTVLITVLLIQLRRRWRAEEKLRQREGELRSTYERNRDLGARLLRAQESERSRIARELHDDICQRILLLTIELETQNRTTSGEPPAYDALAVARDIAKSLHELSHRLHPARLRVIGLAAALGRLCTETSRAGIPIDYAQENVPSRLSADLMLCLFRVVQEALQNAIKYSAAKAVSVRLIGSGDNLTLTIADNGVGFDVGEAWDRGVGLASMVERVEAIGGSLEVISDAGGGGTRLTATVPLHAFQSDATCDNTHSLH